jgi:hypothetical protein
VPPSERTGVLVLRVWIEAGSESGLRARITTENELGSQERVSVVAGTVEQVVEFVEQWVRGFVAGGA